MRGSRAAVCSSSSRILIGASAAISRLTAWRWPPERRPTGSVSRFSRPRPSSASAARTLHGDGWPRAGLSPRARPRAQPRPGSPRSSAGAGPSLGVLEHARQKPRPARRGQPGDVGAIDDDVARVRDHVAGEDAQERRLPAPLLPITVTNWRFRSRARRPAGRGSPGPSLTEHDLDAAQLDHRDAPQPRPQSRSPAGAPPTSSAVTRFRSEASRPRMSASSANAITRPIEQRAQDAGPARLRMPWAAATGSRPRSPPPGPRRWCQGPK